MTISEQRTSHDDNYKSNVEFVKRYYDKKLKPAYFSQYIKATREKFIKAIQAYDLSLLSNMRNPSLQQLHDIIVKNKIHVPKPVQYMSYDAPEDEIEQLKNDLKLDDQEAVAKWKQLRRRYVKQLMNAGEKLSYEMMNSLKSLRSKLQQHGVDVSLHRKEKAWQVFEKDVVKGAQQFLDSKKIVIDDMPLEPKTCIVKQAGGSLDSDVKVTNTKNDKTFFIECKLNFESAQYFKYAIQIKNGRAHYDHKKYVPSEQANDKDVKKINELFTKCIDLDAFLNDVLNSPDVKESWKSFAANIDELCEWIKTSDKFDGTEYKRWLSTVKPFMTSRINENEPISMKLSFHEGTYPDNFKDIVQVFDKYVQYYIDGYNSLIEYMIQNFPDDLMSLCKVDSSDKQFKLDDLKLPHPKMKHGAHVSSNELFQYAARMQANAKAFDDVVDDLNKSLEGQYDDAGREIHFDDAEQVERIAQLMQRIEVKLSTLLRNAGLDENDYDVLKSMKSSDKLKSFFKLFISSVGRKSGDKNPVLDAISDSEGNMQICTPTIVENTRLAQMITDFYVKKDGCAYIQVADCVYLFDEKHNPLGLEKLPVFKDVMTKFRVAINVSDDLDKLKLSIFAMQPDKSCYAGKECISFVPSHSNFICKVLKKPIEVHVKDKR